MTIAESKLNMKKMQQPEKQSYIRLNKEDEEQIIKEEKWVS